MKSKKQQIFFAVFLFYPHTPKQASVLYGKRKFGGFTVDFIPVDIDQLLESCRVTDESNVDIDLIHVELDAFLDNN